MVTSNRPPHFWLERWVPESSQCREQSQWERREAVSNATSAETEVREGTWVAAVEGLESRGRSLTWKEEVTIHELRGLGPWEDSLRGAVRGPGSCSCGKEHSMASTQGWVPYQAVLSQCFLFSGARGGFPEAKQPREVHAQMGNGAHLRLWPKAGPQSSSWKPHLGAEGVCVKVLPGWLGQAVRSTNCCLGHKFPRP